MRTTAAVAPAALLLLAACGGGGEPTAAPDQRLEVEAVSYAYRPATPAVEPGTVRFVVRNASEDEQHGFEVEGQGLEEALESIPPGATDSLTVTLTEPGDYEVYCPVEDHAERGMRTTLTVAAGAGAAR
jgi:plastocyanin